MKEIFIITILKIKSKWCIYLNVIVPFIFIDLKMSSWYLLNTAMIGRSVSLQSAGLVTSKGDQVGP